MHLLTLTKYIKPHDIRKPRVYSGKHQWFKYYLRRDNTILKVGKEFILGENNSIITI